MKAKYKIAYIKDQGRNARAFSHLCKRKQNYEAKELKRNNVERFNKRRYKPSKCLSC